MLNHSTFFIGIDIGDKPPIVVFLDQDGEMIKESRIPTSKNIFICKFYNIPLERSGTNGIRGIS